MAYAIKATITAARAKTFAFPAQKTMYGGRPATELNFKFYRQATNKIVGLSNEVAAFLDGFF